MTGGHSHFRQGARAGRLDIALYRYRPIRVCAGEYDFVFLAPGTPAIVTAAGTVVFVIKQKRAVPKKHCPLPTGGDSPNRALKKPRRGFLAHRDVRRRALYGLRCPHRAAPLGRGLPSATAAPASAPCFRRRRRSPLQLFESSLAASRKIVYKIKKTTPKRVLPAAAGGGEPLAFGVGELRHPNRNGVRA